MTKQINDGGPAFPDGHVVVEGDVIWGDLGLTKRDWFAGLAMQQLIHRREMTETETYTKDQLALESFHYADAMLNHREKRS